MVSASTEFSRSLLNRLEKTISAQPRVDGLHIRGKERIPSQDVEQPSRTSNRLIA